MATSPRPDDPGPGASGATSAASSSGAEAEADTAATDLVPIDEVVARPPPDLEAGSHVGEYRIKRVLGKGGFGVVYEAVQPVIGKPVAIKVLDHRLSGDRSFVARFVTEARAVNQIRHRNIIDIFSFGQLPDGRHYYVMELLKGATLAEVLARRGRLSPEDALDLLAPVARALDAAHGHGFVHRDLKPDNVFIAHDEGRPFPKLLDFGIAKLLGPRSDEPGPTTTAGPVGTPRYMSPEQCRGTAVDPRTDIYALGVMAYELVTGVPLFECRSATELMWSQMTVPPEPPSRRLAGLPAALDAPILRMLAKEPDGRPASAGQAIQELADAVGVTVPTRAAGSITPTDLAVVRAPPPGAAPTAARGTAPPAGARARALVPAPTPTARPAPGRPSTPRGAIAAGAVALLALAASLVVLRGGGGAGQGGGAARPTISAADAATVAVTSPPPDAEAAAAVRAAPADAPPAPPSTVVLDLQGPPSGTEVVGPDGLLLGEAPGQLVLPRGDRPLALVLRKPGYAAVRLSFTPRAGATLRIQMKKRTAPQDGGPGEIPEW